MSNEIIRDTSSSDMLTTDFLLTNVGAPFVIGLAVGYFAKKMLRITLFLGGAAIVLLFISEYYGIISVSNDKLERVTDEATSVVRNSWGFLAERLARFTSKGVSGVGGFFVGFKLG